MASRPLVSVVMSVFNGEPFLAEAIESILAQSFRDFEFIIVDDGSTDCTASVLASYEKSDSRVRVCTQDNEGLPRALNRGCSLAQGNYIARMDADDVSLTGRLGRQVEFLERWPEVGLLGGAVEIIDDRGGSLGLVRPALQDEAIRAALRSFSFPIFHSSVVMRKQAFEEAGGYRARFQHAEDYDLWLRMIERCKAANLPATVLRKRTHAEGVSVRNLRQQTLSALAAHALSSIRERQGAEPQFDGPVITAEFAAELGVSKASQRQALVSGHAMWMYAMLEALQYDAVLRLFEELIEISKPEPVPGSALSTALHAARSIQARGGSPARVWTAVGRALRVGSA